MRRTQSSGKNLHRRGRTSQIKRLKGTGASYNKVTLGTPHFLLSHLKLLSALIASTCLPEKQSTGVAISSLEIIGLRKGIVQRLCYNFPAEADVLRCFMWCFVQALSLSQPVNVNERHDMLSDHNFKLKQKNSEAFFIENGILLLCQQLWLEICFRSYHASSERFGDIRGIKCSEH
jgi:hypothetical protein